jgi:hypothetical protein
MSVKSCQTRAKFSLPSRLRVGQTRIAEISSHLMSFLLRPLPSCFFDGAHTCGDEPACKHSPSAAATPGHSDPAPPYPDRQKMCLSPRSHKSCACITLYMQHCVIEYCSLLHGAGRYVEKLRLRRPEGVGAAAMRVPVTLPMMHMATVEGAVNGR